MKREIVLSPWKVVACVLALMALSGLYGWVMGHLTPPGAM